MCGIAGLIALRPGGLDRGCLQSISDHMRRRGPDGGHDWHDPAGRASLAHRRLSIIDIDSRADQPMIDESGRFVIVFNGEIYNFQELRAELADKGARFRTQSDTEVILTLYRMRGAEAVHALRGMFAFAIWDRETDTAFLARDPYGIKPLYYTVKDGILAFASQVRALVAGGADTEIDPAGLVGFHLFGSVPEPFTLYREISALSAGCTMTVDAAGQISKRRFWSIGSVYDHAAGNTAPANDAEGDVREALLDSIRAHLVSDVPVGLFLSAGIDSGAILGLVQEARAEPLDCVTLAFGEFTGTEQDESPLAAQLAAHYGAHHHVKTVTEDAFRAGVPDIFAAMDQPSVDGVNTFFVSQAAAELGLRVALSGTGGDELFGGYRNFHTIPRDVRRLSAFTSLAWPMDNRALRRRGILSRFDRLDPKVPALLRLGGRYEGAYLARRCVFAPNELTEVLDRDLVEAGLDRLDPIRLLAEALPCRGADAFASVATLESAFYLRNQLLRDSDWAGMYHSLEVRVPLVDARLVERLAPLLMRRGKIDKSWLADSPARALPPAVRDRKKTGFATPVPAWLEADSRLEAWREHRYLRKPNTKWAKRWSKVVLAEFGV